MQIQVGDIFTTPVYTGDFWCILEISSHIIRDKSLYYCKYRKVSVTPPLKYSDSVEVILSKGSRSSEVFLDSKKFRAVRLDGEIKHEKLYLKFMELMLKMDAVDVKNEYRMSL